MRSNLMWIVSNMQATSGVNEGGVLIICAGDEEQVWEWFRRELIKRQSFERGFAKRQKNCRGLSDREALDDLADK